MLNWIAWNRTKMDLALNNLKSLKYNKQTNKSVFHTSNICWFFTDVWVTANVLTVFISQKSHVTNFFLIEVTYQ